MDDVQVADGVGLFQNTFNPFAVPVHERPAMTVRLFFLACVLQTTPSSMSRIRAKDALRALPTRKRLQAANDVWKATAASN